MIDVVIPARNEADTIGPIVQTFGDCKWVNNIIVVIDADSTDATGFIASDYHPLLTLGPEGGGKGQNVMHGLNLVKSPYVIFCDADLTGLSAFHVQQLIKDNWIGPDTMTIGVPDEPIRSPVPWAVRPAIWAMNSGERCLPTSLVRGLDLHGYCMETQINHAAKKAGIPVKYVRLEGVSGKIRNNAVRMAELRRDREWLQKNWKE